MRRRRHESEDANPCPVSCAEHDAAAFAVGHGWALDALKLGLRLGESAGSYRAQMSAATDPEIRAALERGYREQRAACDARIAEIQAAIERFQARESELAAEREREGLDV